MVINVSHYTMTRGQWFWILNGTDARLNFGLVFVVWNECQNKMHNRGLRIPIYKKAIIFGTYVSNIRFRVRSCNLQTRIAKYKQLYVLLARSVVFEWFSSNISLKRAVNFAIKRNIDEQSSDMSEFYSWHQDCNYTRVTVKKYTRQGI